jgi:hypothetical protein
VETDPLAEPEVLKMEWFRVVHMDQTTAAKSVPQNSISRRGSLRQTCQIFLIESVG